MRHLFSWIWVLLVFQFLDEILNFWPSNHFMCFNIVNTLIKGEIMWKSSWYEPWFDNDERLTKLLKWVWWHFGCSWVCELCMSLLLLREFVSFMSLCASLLLLREFVSFMRLYAALLHCASWRALWDFVSLLLLCRLYWAFTSSWGVSFWIELSICTLSVLSSFLPFLEGSCVCLSCFELLTLSSETETSHFERSCACLFTWLLDLLNELCFHSSSFNLFHMMKLCWVLPMHSSRGRLRTNGGHPWMMSCRYPATGVPTPTVTRLIQA